MKNLNENLKMTRPTNVSSVVGTKALLCFSLLIMLSVVSVAQQTPLYTHSYLNPYLYNPALAGDKGVSAAYLMYRKQWAGIDGAPESQVFTLDGALDHYPVGLGVTFFNDITNIIGRTGGAVTGSYKVNLTGTQSLRFGLSFLAIRNRIFFDRIHAEDVSDPNILNAVDQRTVFEGNAGLSYSFKKLKIGFSGEQLFQNTFSYKNEAAFKVLDYQLVRHYYTTAEYTFDLKNEISVRPGIIIRTVQGLPSQIDGNVLLNYKNIAWTNLNYRHGIGGGVSVGFMISDQYVCSYSYEFPTTDLSIIGSSTHEFAIGIRLKGGSSRTAPTASSPTQLDYQTAAQYEKIDALQQQNEQVRAQLDRAEKQLQTQNAELQRLREKVNDYQQDLSSAIEKLSVGIEDSASIGNSSLYLIVGALHSFDDAKLFQRILKREAGMDTRLIRSVSGTWYFLYSHQLENIKEAPKLLKEVRKGPAMPYIIGDPWIYKSEER